MRHVSSPQQVGRSGVRAAPVRAVVAGMVLLAIVAKAAACPFCTVESRTLTEELNSSDAVVLARLIAEAPALDLQSDDESGFGPLDPESGKATFRIEDVLRGDQFAAAGRQIKVVYYGDSDEGKTFMISGIRFEEGALEWTTPLPLSATAVDYIRKLPGVAPSGADRLAFFQDYFEHDDPLLAQDAYDEFARAPYADVKDLKPRMHHDRLVAWIASPEVNPSRRRLYLTMLGVCGDHRDLPMLERMIVSDVEQVKPLLNHMIACGMALRGPIGLPMWRELVELDERRKKLGLDALVACYLTLRGGEGLDLIDERFLKKSGVEYAHVYSAIMALRFHGEEGDVVPRERLLESMRLLLENPDFADQVIPDLSRWEDWSVLERLVEMYKTGDDKSYIRQPVVTYLTVASEQPGPLGERATAALAELEQLDPEGVKRARSLMAFGLLARARGPNDLAGATRPDENGAAADNGRATSADLAIFAATPAEMAAAENAEPDDFPDPARFGAERVPPVDAAVDELDERVEVVESAATAEVESVPSEVATYSRPLVIGVPLAAMMLLVVLYWLILRWGAV